MPPLVVGPELYGKTVHGRITGFERDFRWFNVHTGQIETHSGPVQVLVNGGHFAQAEATIRAKNPEIVIASGPVEIGKALAAREAPLPSDVVIPYAQTHGLLVGNQLDLSPVLRPSDVLAKGRRYSTRRLADTPIAQLRRPTLFPSWFPSDPKALQAIAEQIWEVGDPGPDDQKWTRMAWVFPRADASESEGVMVKVARASRPDRAGELASIHPVTGPPLDLIELFRCAAGHLATLANHGPRLLFGPEEVERLRRGAIQTFLRYMPELDSATIAALKDPQLRKALQDLRNEFHALGTKSSDADSSELLLLHASTLAMPRPDAVAIGEQALFLEAIIPAEGTF